MGKPMELVLRRGNQEFKLELFDPEDFLHKHDPDIACCFNHFDYEIDDLDKIEAKLMEMTNAISPNYKARNVLRLVLSFLLKCSAESLGDTDPRVIDVREMMQGIDD